MSDGAAVRPFYGDPADPVLELGPCQSLPCVVTPTADRCAAFSFGLARAEEALLPPAAEVGDDAEALEGASLPPRMPRIA